MPLQMATSTLGLGKRQQSSQGVTYTISISKLKQINKVNCSSDSDNKSALNISLSLSLVYVIFKEYDNMRAKCFLKKLQYNL